MAQVVVAVAKTIWFVAKSVVLGTGPVAKVIRAVTIVAGSYSYQRAQAKKAERALSSAIDSSRIENVRTVVSSRKIIVGQIRRGGDIIFSMQTGTNKEYTHVVIVHGWRECDSFVAHYLNGEAVTLDGSGNVTSPAKWVGRVRILNHLGSDTQTVDTVLQAAVGASTWSNNHRGRGCCYSYVQYKTDSDVFSEGLPVYTADIKGAKWYDPRTGLTAWTDNPIIILRGWMLLSKDLGGYGAPASSIPDSWWNAQANICDEDVSLAAGGTENRYSANGLIDTATERGTIIRELMGAAAGECNVWNRKFYPRVGAYTTPVMDISDEDLVGPVDCDPRDSMRDMFNGVRGVYTGPLTQWQPGDFPYVKNDTYMAEDNNERIWHDMVLNFTTSASQCQRIAKIRLEESRQDITEVIACKLKVQEIVPGDIITRTSPAMGWVAKPFLVRHVVTAIVPDEKTGNPLIVPGLHLRGTASGVFDWNNGEETSVDLAPNTTLSDPNSVQTPTGLNVTDENFSQPNGSFSPRLKVEWTAPTDVKILTNGFVHIEYKKSADSTWIVWTTKLRGDATQDFINDVLGGVAYDVRVRFENSLRKVGSYATDSTTITDDSEYLAGGVLGRDTGASTVNGTSPQAVSDLQFTISAPAGTRKVTYIAEIGNASGSTNDIFVQIYADGSPIGSAIDLLAMAPGEARFFTWIATENLASPDASRTYQIYAWGSGAHNISAGGEIFAE